MTFIKKELNIFFTGLMFYTRIPVPKWVEYKEEYLNQSTRYFPLMGYIVGGFAALMFYLLLPYTNMYIAVLCSMGTGILVTGAFHEDGFADSCDGFGGGYTAEKILTIMKDSRIGTYGTIGLIMMLGLKFTLLTSIKPEMIIISIIAAHALSRLAPVLIMGWLNYARADLSSKSKPIAKKVGLKNIIIASIIGIAPCVYMGYEYGYIYLILLAIPVIIHLPAGLYFKKWLGGYTGDCLGATQQIAEVATLLCLVILINKPG